MSRYQGFEGLSAAQYDDEWPALLQLAQSEGVQSYLEIGSHNGVAFHSMASSLPAQALCVSVDWPVDDSQGPLVIGRVMAALAGSRRVISILANSQEPLIVKAVTALAPFDLVFIDGDHSNEGVQADWSNYGPLGKMVAFHDITSNHCHFVRSLWDSVKGQYRSRELIGQFPEMGIGVLWRE